MALGALGHRVTLVVPKYAGVATPGAAIDRFTVTLGARDEDATCYEVPLGPNARAILVEHPGFFEREFIYGSGEDDYRDNPRRFAFLSRAALEFAAREGERIDVVQSFDWQTGLVPVFLRRTYGARPALRRPRRSSPSTRSRSRACARPTGCSCSGSSRSCSRRRAWSTGGCSAS